MNTHNQIPIEGADGNASAGTSASATADNHPLKRHHTAGYYMHRVQDSLTTRVCKLICTIILGLLLVLGIITFLLWISLRPHRPRFHIRDFSIPGLAQQNRSGEVQVIFNLTARNSNQNIGIYYYAMQMTVYYKDQSIGGASLSPPFYQRPKNTVVLHSVLRGATLRIKRQRWMPFRSGRTKGMIVFRLDVTSTIRFRVLTWRTMRHKMHANCAVGVGPNGLILATYKDKRCPVYFT